MNTFKIMVTEGYPPVRLEGHEMFVDDYNNLVLIVETGKHIFRQWLAAHEVYETNEPVNAED